MSDPAEALRPPHRYGRREALKITAVVGASVVAGGGLVRGLLRRASLTRVGETRTRMGTVVMITVVHPEADEAREMVSAAFTELERLEGILSRHRAGTPVHRLNEVGSLTDAPIELIEVLTAAAGYSDLTAGAFDVTVAPLLALFERTFRDEGRAPSPQEVGQVLERVDYRGVRVRGRHIQLARGMALTLDGIAKGYIVDRTVTVLADRGAGRVLVDAGGDMAAAGPGSAEEPWRVGV